MSDSTVDLAYIETEAIALVREVGQRIREKRESQGSLRLEEKGAQNLVTESDELAERLLVEGLGNILPGSGFLGEEGTSSSSQNGYQWIIDPIDGTTNYVHNLGCYSISVALYHGDEPVIGIVHDITREEVYHSRTGTPAFVNGQEIHVSQQTKVYHSLLATGFPYDQHQTDQFMALYKHFLYNSRGVRRLGSAALDLAYVASGRFEGFYEYGLQAWDVAAGAFLVQQAGGTVSSFAGSADFIADRTLVATNGRIHSELLAVLTDHLK